MSSEKLWRVIGKNVRIILLLISITYPALALEQVETNIGPSLVPVAMGAVFCGWWFGGTQLSANQSTLRLLFLGILGVLLYFVDLVSPFGRLMLSTGSVFIQSVKWLFDRTPIFSETLFDHWIDLSSRVLVAFIRSWEWTVSLVAGELIVDPAAAGLVFGFLIWMIGVWSGWQMRRKKGALQALLPGGITLAFAVNYSGMNADMVLLYFVNFLILMALSHYDRMLSVWQRENIDYSESIAADSAFVAIPAVIVLVVSASIAQTYSWQEIKEIFQERKPEPVSQVVEPVEIEPSPEVALAENYFSDELPRLLLLSTPPEKLDDLVMMISVDDNRSTSLIGADNTPPRYYWRTVTLDLYTGRGWTSRPAREILLPAGVSLIEPMQDYHLVEQRVELVSEQSQAVYWTGTLVQADVDINVAWRIAPPSNADRLRYADMFGALTTTNAYNVLSYLPEFSPAELRKAGRNYPPEIVRRYLYVPDSVPERVLVLAHEITGTELSPYDQVLALEVYLHQFPYALEVVPPPLDQDVVDYFLFTAQKGYCDYYASAMVVMARAVGLPARIVVGYASGDYDPATSQYIVRRKDAHTWVEIYFSGIGWVEFEPTASLPALSEVEDMGYAQEMQQDAPVGSVLPWVKEQWISLKSLLGRRILFGIGGLVFVLVFWLESQRLYLYLLGSSQAVVRMYNQVEKAAKSLLPDLPTGYTAQELQIALSDKLSEVQNDLGRRFFRKVPQRIEKITLLYMLSSYSERKPSTAEVHRGIREWSRLRRTLWFARILNRIKQL